MRSASSDLMETTVQRGQELSHELCFEIAGVGVAVRWQGFWLRGLPPSYQDFISPAQADIAFRILNGLPPLEQRQDPLFNAPGNWKLFRQNGSHRFEIIALDRGRVGQVAIMNANLTKGEVFVHPRWRRSGTVARGILRQELPPGRPMVPTWSVAQLISPLGQLCLIQYLAKAKERGLMCHALGVIDQGRGLLFVGPSGSGKSTLARFWSEAGATVLGDERIIIRNVQGQYRIYGTPWPGETRLVSRQCATLSQLYFLSHAKAHTVKGESRIRQFASFFPQVLFPRWDLVSVSRLMEFTEKLLEEVPSTTLAFAKAPTIIPFLRRGLGGGNGQSDS